MIQKRCKNTIFFIKCHVFNFIFQIGFVENYLTRTAFFLYFCTL